jgi:6-phosphogluconolactonase
LTQVPVPAANIHPFPVAASESERHEGATPGLAATRYEHLLRRLLNTETEVPTVDLVLLGMGDDGHTASLFPHTEALREQRALVVANPVPKLNAVRLTLTFPILNAARDLFVLVSGRGKAETLAAVLDGPERGDDLPIQLIRPHPGDLTWLVDEAAAIHLHHLEATDE